MQCPNDTKGGSCHFEPPFVLGMNFGLGSAGYRTEKNRLYYDGNNYTFVDEKAAYKDLKRYDVTQVRPNDGKKLEETIAQPARP